MIFVEITGNTAAFVAAALPTMAGVLFDEHAVTPLDDDQWRVGVYVESDTVISQIEATGLTVRVLQTAAQVQAEEDRIVARLGGGGTS